MAGWIWWVKKEQWKCRKRCLFFNHGTHEVYFICLLFNRKTTIILLILITKLSFSLMPKVGGQNYVHIKEKVFKCDTDTKSSSSKRSDGMFSSIQNCTNCSVKTFSGSECPDGSQSAVDCSRASLTVRIKVRKRHRKEKRPRALVKLINASCNRSWFNYGYLYFRLEIV